MLLQTIRSHLRILFNEAVASVNPQKLVQDCVGLRFSYRDGLDYLVVGGKEYNLQSNFYIVGFGKAALSMARTVEHIIKPHLMAGIINIPVGSLDYSGLSNYELLTSRLQIFECAENNLPDEEAKIATQRITDLIKGLDPSEPNVIIVLISGGGSALLTLPVTTISLDEKLDVIKLLVNAGATIVDLNCVRKKLSLVKGGGLARIAYPTQVISMTISDVVGDHIDIIASGPTCPSLDAPYQAWEVIVKYNLQSKISDNIFKALTFTNDITPHDDFSHVSNVLIGSNAIALAAINTKAQSMNYSSVILSDKVQGIARNVGGAYALIATYICLLWASKLGFHQFVIECIAVQMANKIDFFNRYLIEAIFASKKFNKPLCLVFGGETTVLVTGSGIGGRNQELALAFAIDMHEKCEMHSVLKNFEIVLLSAGTDGIDGPTDVAGADGYSHLIHEAQAQYLDPMLFLDNNNSYNFFSKLCNGDNLIRTGPTGTNVMDVHILVIAPYLKGGELRSKL